MIERLCPLIIIQTTQLRKQISAEQRLPITIQISTTGKLFESLMYQYRVHERPILHSPQRFAQLLFKDLRF